MKKMSEILEKMEINNPQQSKSQTKKFQQKKIRENLLGNQMEHGKKSEYNPIFQFIGDRYREASLSKLNLTTEEQNQIYQWMKSKSGFLIYEGSVGVGKTYTMIAIAKFLFDSQIKRGIRYPSIFCYPEYAIYKKISSSWSNPSKSEEDEKRILTETKILFIDDLGASTSHDWQKTAMFEIIDSRYNSNLKTFFTTNLSATDIGSRFHERLVDRLESRENIWIKYYSQSKRK